MPTYRERFRKRHTLLVVVHVLNREQALRNAWIAREEGADGIFLINHGQPSFLLMECYVYVKESLPRLWVGLNHLGMNPSDILITNPEYMEGLWADNAGITEGEDSTAKAERFSQLRKETGWKGLYFGGIAFKYQTPVQDPAKVAKLAMPYVDVITTSGAGTGVAADVEKIRIMKEAIGDHPLAIASGITPENVAEYMPCADCFLVATGISRSHSELDPARVRALVRAIGE